MIRHVRRKKQHRILEKISKIIFTIAIFSFFASSIFLRTYNVHLSVQIQDIQNRMIQLRQDNETLSVEIQKLSSKERVVAIANENGLEINQANIVLIQSGE